jgi:hypothetical protein
MKKLELLIRIEDLENLVLELKHQLTSHCASTNDVVKLLEENYERVSTLQNELATERGNGVKILKLLRKLEDRVESLQIRPVDVSVPNVPCAPDRNPPLWLPYTPPMSPTGTPYDPFPFVTVCQTDSNTMASQLRSGNIPENLKIFTNVTNVVPQGCPG